MDLKAKMNQLFKVLRANGVFARQCWKCCQGCGCAASRAASRSTSFFSIAALTSSNGRTDAALCSSTRAATSVPDATSTASVLRLFFRTSSEKTACSRRVGGKIPAAFGSRNVHDAVSSGLLSTTDGVHSEVLDAGASSGISGKGCGNGIDRLITAPRAHQASRNDERATQDYRSAINDMAHRVEFFLAIFKSSFKVSKCASDIFQVEAHILTSFAILLKLQPTVLPEGDFLGEALMHRVQSFFDVSGSAARHFVVVFWHQGRSSKRNSAGLLVCHDPRCSQYIFKEWALRRR